MNYILDLLVIAIIAVFAVVSAKKGFVKTVVGLVGTVLALYFAVMLSTPISDFTYGKIIEPTVKTAINNSVENALNGTESVIKEDILEALPAFVKNRIDIENFNISVESDIAGSVCETAVKPLSLTFLKPLFSLILFIIFAFVVKFAAKFLNKIFSFSIIGKANKILGAVIGIVKGMVFAAIFIICVQLIISLTGGFLIFTEEAVTSSVLVKFVIKLLPANFI